MPKKSFILSGLLVVASVVTILSIPSDASARGPIRDRLQNFFHRGRSCPSCGGGSSGSSSCSSCSSGQSSYSYSTQSSGQICTSGSCSNSQSQLIMTVTTEAEATTTNALDEVNARRARSGLRPFIHDDGLAAAALACARHRAANLLFGHTGNDFQFLPSGCNARAAGCAAYPASYGWCSCCVEDNATYAGAAWVMGRDGKRYMSLFVR